MRQAGLSGDATYLSCFWERRKLEFNGWASSLREFVRLLRTIDSWFHGMLTSDVKNGKSQLGNWQQAWKMLDLFGNDWQVSRGLQSLFVKSWLTAVKLR
jgi:hypothetical protein